MRLNISHRRAPTRWGTSETRTLTLDLTQGTWDAALAREVAKSLRPDFGSPIADFIGGILAICKPETKMISAPSVDVEVIDALEKLGYSAKEAREYASNLSGSVEEQTRMALQRAGK
jgi:hypothetical protein